jgi:hypothetical protein
MPWRAPPEGERCIKAFEGNGFEAFVARDALHGKGVKSPFELFAST